jgi:hypothetical protein
VLRIVVSNDSMKKATATSHGNKRMLAGESAGLSVGGMGVAGELIPGDLIRNDQHASG